ncbi:MAG: hypothetical protein LBN10_01605 [Propionibacteriaceae bacterium]|nr:hypothetical protein [Propionibacteriaceae bacterium]
MSRASKEQQVKHVVEGVAMGVLAQGVVAVRSSKMEFESAFTASWRAWPRAASFPSVGRTDPGNLFWLGVGKSERTRDACVAWETGQWTTPYITQDRWSAGDCLEVHEDERASARDWKVLGHLFVNGFKDEHIKLAV